MADENTGKIYIIVTNKLPSGETPTPEGVKNPSAKEDKQDSLFAHWAKNQILGLVKQTATQAVNYSINNMGNFKGQYEAQAQINNAKVVLGKIMSFGQAGASGFMVGGVPGMLIALGVQTVNTAVSIGMEIHSTQVAINKLNRENDILRERSGLNEYMDGSRGTLY